LRIFVAGFQRWLVVGTWTVFFLIGLSGLTAGDASGLWFAAVCGTVSFLLVVRSLYAFSLTLTGSALVVRSWERTNTIPLGEIVAVRTGLVSRVIGVENHVLFVATRDGRERRFVSISGSQRPRKPIHDLPRRHLVRPEQLLQPRPFPCRRELLRELLRAHRPQPLRLFPLMDRPPQPPVLV